MILSLELIQKNTIYKITKKHQNSDAFLMFSFKNTNQILKMFIIYDFDSIVI